MGRIAWHGKKKPKEPQSELTAHIGSQLFKLRQKRQIPMRTVAEEAGLSAAFVCDLENGLREPGATTLLKLSEAFDVPVAYWFAGYKPKPKG